MDFSVFHHDPLEQFRLWLAEAEKSAGLAFPNAMNLATLGEGGRPSSRMVLLKGQNKDGFCFFTNFESRKGQELTNNPYAALCFYWEALGWQVRAEGAAKRLSIAESEEYFHSRPRQSQVGAWASPQSREIPSREALEEKVRETELRFQGQEALPLPPHWGGFCLVPDRMEFWINGENRLHDRIEYKRTAAGSWARARLAP